MTKKKDFDFDIVQLTYFFLLLLFSAVASMKTWLNQCHKPFFYVLSQESYFSFYIEVFDPHLVNVSL